MTEMSYDNHGEPMNRVCPICEGTSHLGRLMCPHCVNGAVSEGQRESIEQANSKLCHHDYNHMGRVGNCEHKYRCAKCGDEWVVDSSD